MDAALALLLMEERPVSVASLLTPTLPSDVERPSAPARLAKALDIPPSTLLEEAALPSDVWP